MREEEHMNLQQLSYFKTIAELKHFTKAANRLIIGQSTLSHSIQNFEDELGVKLFSRQGKSIALTKYGELFLPYVNGTLDTLNEGIRMLKEQTDPDSGTVSICYPPSIAPFIPYIITKYIADTDRVNTHFNTHQGPSDDKIHDMVASGNDDVALCNVEIAEDIDCLDIGEHELVLLVSKEHRLAERESIELNEINGEKFIAYDRDTYLRRKTDLILKEHNIEINIMAETAQDNVIYGLAGSNHGVAITPRPVGILPESIHALRINDPRFVIKLGLCWNSENYISPAVRNFINYFAENPNLLSDFMNMT